MYFEFKSTFQIIKKQIIRAGRIPASVWLLLVNSAITLTAAHLYLNNYIIPAVIGSRYYGNYYMSIVEAVIFFLIATSACAILSLLVTARINHRDYQGPDIFMLKLFHYIRQSSLIIIMLIHLSRFMPRRFAPMRLLIGTYSLCHSPLENKNHQH